MVRKRIEWPGCGRLISGRAFGIRLETESVRVRTLEFDAIVVTLVIVPPLSNAMGIISDDAKQRALRQAALNIIELDRKRKLVPRRIKRTRHDARWKARAIRGHDLARGFPVIGRVSYDNRFRKGHVSD